MKKQKNSTTAREQILQRINQAVGASASLHSGQISSDELLHNPGADLLLHFAETFTNLQGNFSFCLSVNEFVSQLNALLESRQWNKIYCAEPLLRGSLTAAGLSAQITDDIGGCDAAITTVEALVARTGSMVLSSAIPKGRTASAYAPVHIALAYASQVVADIGSATQMLQQRYGNSIPSFITFATGPSRTADIEKTLVTGVHGPGEVYCFVVDNSNG